MIGLRKNRNSANAQAKQCRSSMIVTGSNFENIIQLSFGAGCFKGKNVRNIDSKDSMTLYNFLCSLFVFSLHEFNDQKFNSTLKKSERRQRSQTQNILVIIDATKIPIKALRIILRACQSALAYKIRQAIIVEPEGFLGQQRVGIDILLDSYDFKTTICPKSKLWKYLSIGSDFYDINKAPKLSTSSPFSDNTEWKNIKKGFQEYFVNNTNHPSSSNQQSTSFFRLTLTTSSASLSKFMRKNNCILIELIENDLDTISIQNMLKNQDQDCRDSLDLSNKIITSDKFTNDTFNKIEKRHSRIEVLNNLFCKQSLENNLISNTENSQRNVTTQLIRHKSKHSKTILIDEEREKILLPPSKPLIKLKYSANELKSTQLLNKDQINEQRCEKNIIILKTVNEQICLIEELFKWFVETGEPIFVKIDVRSMPTFLLCCSNFLNNNDKSKDLNISYDSKMKIELEEVLESTEKIIDKCATINELIENLELKIREINGDEYKFDNDKNDSSLMLKNKNELDNIFLTLLKKMHLLKQMATTISKKVHTFRTKLNKQTLKIKNYQRFRRAVTQFYKESDEMLKQICCNSEIELNQIAIQAEISTLKKKMSCCEEKLNIVAETGTSFCAILRSTTTDPFNDNNSDNTTNVIQRAEIAQKMEFVAENLTAVSERRKSCYELVKSRISRLKQAEEIIKCENFGTEIIEKMIECFENIQKGRPTLSTVVNNRKTEKRLYNYAKHLNHVAFVLRRLHGHELRPNIILTEKLETIWTKLNPKSSSLIRCG